MKKLEHLKYILSRMDGYIESTQSKSNLYLIINTIVISGILSFADQITGLNISYKLSLLIILVISVFNVILTLSAINPFLKSTNDTKKSRLFFADISSLNHKKYSKKIKKLNDEKLIKDISCQIHSLATGLTKKYNKLTIIGYTTAIQFILIVVWLFIFTLNQN